VLETDIATGVLVSQLPGLVALVVGALYSRTRVPALQRHVDEFMPATSGS
jgi:hypothetical protein